MMGLLGQSVLVSCIPECHSMPRFVIQRQSYGLGFGAFADAGKLDTLGGASSVSMGLNSRTKSMAALCAPDVRHFFNFVQRSTEPCEDRFYV